MSLNLKSRQEYRTVNDAGQSRFDEMSKRLFIVCPLTATVGLIFIGVLFESFLPKMAHKRLR